MPNIRLILISILTIVIVVIASSWGLIKREFINRSSSKKILEPFYQALKKQGINTLDRNIILIVGPSILKKEFILNLCTEYSCQTTTIANPTKTDIIDEVIIVTIHDNAYIAFIEKDTSIDNIDYNIPLIDILRQVSQTNKFLNSILLLLDSTTIKNDKLLLIHKNTISCICKLSDLNVPVYVLIDALNEVRGLEKLIEQIEYKYYFQMIGISADKYSVTPFTTNEASAAIKVVNANIIKLAISTLNKKNTTSNAIQIISIEPQLKTVTSTIITNIINSWKSFNIPKPPILRGIFFTARFSSQADNLFLFVSDLLLKKLPAEADIINIGAKQYHQYKNKKTELLIALVSTIMTIYIILCSLSLISHGMRIKATSDKVVTSIRIANQDSASIEDRKNAKVQTIQYISDLIKLNKQKTYNLLLTISDYMLKNKNYIWQYIVTKCTSTHNIVKKDVSKHITNSHKINCEDSIDIQDRDFIINLIFSKYDQIYQALSLYNKLESADNSTLRTLLELVIITNNLPRNNNTIQGLADEFISIPGFVQLDMRDFTPSESTIAHRTVAAAINSTNRLNDTAIKHIEDMKDAINILVANNDISSSIKATEIITNVARDLDIDTINTNILFKACTQILDDLLASKCISNYEYKAISKIIANNIDENINKITNIKCKIIGPLVQRKGSSLILHSDLVDLITKLATIKNDNSYRQTEAAHSQEQHSPKIHQDTSVIVISQCGMDNITQQLIEFANLLVKINSDSIFSDILKVYLGKLFDASITRAITTDSNIVNVNNNKVALKCIGDLNQNAVQLSKIIHLCTPINTLPNTKALISIMLDRYVRLVYTTLTDSNIIDPEIIVSQISIDADDAYKRSKASSITSNIINNSIPKATQLLAQCSELLLLINKYKDTISEIQKLEFIQKTVDMLADHSNNGPESLITRFVESITAALSFSLTNADTCNFHNNETLSASNDYFGKTYFTVINKGRNKLKNDLEDYTKDTIRKLTKYLTQELKNTYPIVPATQASTSLTQEQLDVLKAYLRKTQLIIQCYQNAVGSTTQMVSTVSQLNKFLEELINTITQSGTTHIVIQLDPKHKLSSNPKLTIINGNNIEERDCKDSEPETFKYTKDTSILLLLPAPADALAQYQKTANNTYTEVTDIVKMRFESPIKVTMVLLNKQFGTHPENDGEHNVILNIPIKQTIVNRVTANLETKITFMNIEIKLYLQTNSKHMVNITGKIIKLLKSMI